MLGDFLHRALPALGLADHRQKAQFQHHVSELVHPGRRCRARRANDFTHYGIDRTDIVDRPVPEIDGQFFTLGEHVLNPLVRRIAPCQHAAVEQQPVAMLPATHFLKRQVIEIDALGRGIGRPIDLRPIVQTGLFKEARPRTVKREMRMAGGGAVGNHRHGLAGGMARPVHDLDIEYR